MEASDDDPISRRRFVGKSAGITVSALAAGAGMKAMGVDDEVPAADPPVDPHPCLTPADEFYTVARGNPKPHTLKGQALVDARMTPESWRLEVGTDSSIDPPDIKLAAKTERVLTIADGSALDMRGLAKLGEKHGVKYLKAMQCLNISEPLGQGLWEGVPLREVLRLCGRMENVRRIYYRGFHNNDPGQVFRSSVSYTQAMETPPGELPVFLAYRLNGEPISPIRGGPVRMIVPWAYGFKSIKWLQEIFLTNDYRVNDTYALRNNDPESFLKTAAYVDDGGDEVPHGEPVSVTGQVISGLSGLDRVEYWVRAVGRDDKRLGDGAVELLRARWKPCRLFAPPVWKDVLPAGVSSKDLLGFDSKTGAPLSWPTRYGMASWHASLRGLKRGIYEVYARAVDGNGFAQPEPRPTRKSGKNMIQLRRFEVV